MLKFLHSLPITAQTFVSALWWLGIQGDELINSEDSQVSNANKNKKLANYELNVLLDLKKNATSLKVSYSARQFVGMILEVLPDGQFLFGLNPVDQNSQFLSVGKEELTFVAESSGEKVTFKCVMVGTKRDDTITGFICEVTTDINVTQHRKYFRVKIPSSPPCYCYGIFPDGSKFQFVVADISVGGIGLYADNKTTFSLREDDVIHGAVVDLGDFDKYEFNLKYIREIEKTVVGNSGGVVSKRLLSFQFIKLDKIKQQELERLIIALQQHQAAESRRRNMMAL